MELGWQQNLLLVHHLFWPIGTGQGWSGLGRPLLTLSPVTVPDEEVITIQRWKRNQGCLEGIKEWENRIQSASWSLEHITASGHSFQMPCIFQCAATFPMPSLGEFKVSASLHDANIGRVIRMSWERKSSMAAPKRDSKPPHYFGINSGSSLRSYGSLRAMSGI